MTPLEVLFIGGTGEISAACSRRAVELGMNLHVLNRGRASLRALPAEATLLTADVRDRAATEAAIRGREFDVVVNFVAFMPDHVQADIDLFAGRAGQYVFISSASAYQTPPAQLPITESTPLGNHVWPYSQAKIACEDRLLAAHRERGYPVTIVRPSHTYDRTGIPYDPGWTVIERMRSGKPVIVHGDGTSLWTLTHADDFAKAFVGLLGHPAAVGDSFHITSDEALTWNAIHEILADAAGAEARIVHVPSDLIARHDEEWGRALLGDKAHSMVFDNTKVRRLVPGYVATTPFAHGAREMIAWHDADASRRQVDPRFDRLFDDLVERYAVTS